LRQRWRSSSVPDQPHLARLVMLASLDLRRALATVDGFAHALARTGGLEDPAPRYLEMITAASGQMADLLDELSLAGRIESGRYEPMRREVDTLDLARSAAERLGEERVEVSGDGAGVEVDVEATERAVAALTRCALRHGGLEQVRLVVQGARLEL